MHHTSWSLFQNNFNAKAALAFAITLLTACGGGGGGSPSYERSIPALEYEGLESAAVISDSNASDIGLGVYRALSLIIDTTQLFIPVGDSSGSSSGNVPGNQGGEAIITIKLSNGLGTITIDFQQFREENLFLNGRLVQQTRSISNTGSNIDVLLLFEQLEMRSELAEDDFNITLDGTLDWVAMPLNNVWSHTILAELIFIAIDNMEMGYLKNIRIVRELSGQGTWVGQRWDTVMTGRVYDSNEGFVDITTEAPWIFKSTEALKPFLGGDLRASGAGSAVRIRPLNRLFGSIHLDKDDDGISEVSRRFEWDSLSSDPTNNQPPSANAGSYAPIFLGENAQLTGLFSADTDEEMLAFNWHLAVAPAGNTAELKFADSPTPEFVPNAVGDYLVTMSVSDGSHVIHDAALMKVVAPGTGIKPIQGKSLVIPSMQRPKDGLVGQLIKLDARASYTDFFDDNLLLAWKVQGPQGEDIPVTLNESDQASFIPTKPGLYYVNINARSEVTSSSGNDFGRIISIGTDSRFHPMAQLNTGTYVWKPLAGNFDTDPQEDIVFKSTNFNRPDLIMGISSFRFEAPGEINLTSQAFTMNDPVAYALPDNPMTAGDLNNDGIDDIVAANIDEFSVLISNETGVFERSSFALGPPACSNSFYPHAVAIGDTNVDNLPDLIVADTCSRQIITLLQDQDGNLKPPTYELFPDSPSAIVGAIGDLNSDGRLDIITVASRPSSSSAARYSVWLRQTDGQLLLAHTEEIPNVGEMPKVVIEDLNDDDRPDIAAIASYRLITNFQKTDGTLDEAIQYDFSAYSSMSGGKKLRALDFNGDGLVDISIDNSRLILLQNEGRFDEALHMQDLVYPRFGNSPIPVDINFDGLPDWVAGSSVSGVTGIDGATVLLARPPDL